MHPDALPWVWLFFLGFAACLTAYITFGFEGRGRFSDSWATRLLGIWIGVLGATAIVFAVDVMRDCDWQAIQEMWGWCTPCAYYYWYSIGCE